MKITGTKLGIAVYRERARASRGWRVFVSCDGKSQEQNSELPFIASEQDKPPILQILKRPKGLFFLCINLHLSLIYTKLGLKKMYNFWYDVTVG